MITVRDWMRRPVMLVSVAALLVSATMWLVIPRVYRAPSVWGRYAAIVTPLDAVEAQKRLSDAGIEDVVGPDTSEVMVTRFSRIDEIPLDVALDELDVLDPRRDDFMERGIDWFESGDSSSIVYAPTDGGLWRLDRVVRRALGSGSRVADYFPMLVIAAVIAYLLATGLLIVFVARNKVATVGAAVAWLPIVISCGLPGLVAATTVLAGWTLSLHDLRSTFATLRGRSAPSLDRLVAALWPVLAVVLSGLLLMSWFGGRVWIQLVIAVLGTTGMTLIVRAPSTTSTDHELFRPVSLFTGSHEAPNGLAVARSHPLIMAGVVACLLVIPPAADAMRPAPVDVPRPSDTAAHQISYDSVLEHWENRGPGLVDISDYIAHRAYQETLEYGREYGPPSPSEAVTLSRFAETDTGSYVRFGEDVAVFDDAWLSAAIADPPKGVAEMLVSLGRVSGVVAGPERGLYSGYSQVLKHSVFVILVVLPVTLFGRRVPGIRRQSKVVEIVRRRKQVA